MNYEFRILKISAIRLDQANPRFPSVKTQRDAIKAMLEEQGDKIYTLALDILQHGLDPSKRLIVFKEKKQFIDGDGNRRLTALKILETPELIKGHRHYEKFSKLSKKKSNLKKTEQVECVIFQSRREIKHWLEINHGGELDGRGQIKWSSEQKQRFNGAKSIGFLAKEKLLSKKLISDEEFSLVKVTTLTRLLDSKPGKKNLSITKKDGEVSFNDLKSLLIVYKKLMGKSVKEVYHDKDRKIFLSDIYDSIQSNSFFQKNNDSIICSDSIKKATIRKTQRVKTEDVPIFGEVLSLKPGLVNNIYRDICEIYKQYKLTGTFVEILGFSMRLILDVAAHEYFSKNPKEGLKKNAIYKEYLKLIKEGVLPKDKNTLSVDKSIKNLIEEENVEALLAKLAHGSIRPSIEMVLNLSFIICPILNVHFAKEDT